MKYLLDTNVYLDAVPSEERRARFRQTFFPLIPATYLSAVVAYELAVSAKDRRTQNLVREFILPMERTGRVVTPTFSDWITASEVVTAIASKESGWRSKSPGLLNDVLIAASARPDRRRPAHVQQRRFSSDSPPPGFFTAGFGSVAERHAAHRGRLPFSP